MEIAPEIATEGSQTGFFEGNLAQFPCGLRYNLRKHNGKKGTIISGIA